MPATYAHGLRARLTSFSDLQTCCLAGTLLCLFRVYAYAVGDGEGSAEGEAAKPAQNDFHARLAMFKQKETGPSGGGA